MRILRPNGFTLIELLIVSALVGIIASIAVPGLIRARMSSDEAAAIGSLRAINSGQAAYSSSCASGFFATSLSDLAKAPSGSSAAFISPDLNRDTTVKSGYSLTLAKAVGANDSTATACNAPTSTPASAYYASAAPVVLHGTGTRAFATDVRGTIFQAANTATPPADPIASSATPVQ